MKHAVEAIRLFKLLNRDQRRTFLACFLGWALDAFDFFLLTFVIVPMAHDFGTSVADLTYAITITLAMLPGMSNVQGLSFDEKQLKRTEAIVLSMTNEERTRPDILNARRRQRIARGSGSTVTEVNDLLRRFDQMRKLMKNAGKMKKMMAQMTRTRT